MYQLCLGGETFSTLLDRIAERACAVAPGLDPEACRNLIYLVFRARIRKTEACGRYPECVPESSVWGDRVARAGETCDWEDLDPQGLPRMFGAVAADLAETPAIAQQAVEEQLARVFQGALAELLFHNPSCGRAAVCRAEPVFPLRPLPLDRR